jgi:hypothetical protein
MRAALTSSIGAPRAVCLILLVLGACLVPAAAVMATPANPEYFLSVVEGETTRPEEPITSTSASVRHTRDVTVSIVRGGIVVARSSGNEGAYLSQVPQVGDVVTLESPLGVLIGAVAYDGLPSLDPTVCAGSVSFSGQRSTGETVEGGAYSFGSHTDPYGHTNFFRTGAAQAQVTVLSGPAFAGNFLAPLGIGQTVWASESLQTPLAGGSTFTYSSETDRPVAGCPPAPIAAPAPPPPLQGSILRLLRTTIAKLLKSGWNSQVTINQPGTVIQDLYLQGGTLPAFAAKAKSKHHPRKPPALLLARGSAGSAAGGRVTVHLKVTAKGRKRLKHATSVKAVLVTTLVGKSGKLSLGHHTVTLHR